MKRFTSIFSLLLLLTIVSMTVGCQKPEKKEPPKKKQAQPIDLEVVIHESLKQPVKALLRSLDHTVINNHMVHFQSTIYSGYEDVSQIADGRVKNDLWFSPTHFTVEWSNAHIKNLGATHSNCDRLATSPIILTTSKDLGVKLCSGKKQCTWGAIQSYFQDKTTTPRFGHMRAISFVPPTVGPIASLAWANIFIWTKGRFDDQITANLNHTRPWQKHLQTLEVADTTAAINKIIHSQAEEQIFAVLPKSDLHTNRSNIPGKTIAPLSIPVSSSYHKEINVCRSDGDWVTPVQKSIIKQLIQQMQSPANKALLESYGYNPEQAKSFEVRKFDKNRSIRDLAEKSWEQLRRPTHYTILLDASASMEQDNRLRDLQRALRIFIARQSSDTQYSLIRFSTEPKTLVSFAKAGKELYNAIDQVTAIGGSAIFDSISFAYEHTIQVKPPLQRRILIITDGGDKNSRLKKFQLEQMLRQRAEWRAIDHTLISIRHKENDATELYEIAKAANGRFENLTSDTLSTFLGGLHY